MGSGCVCQNSAHPSLARVRTVRLGNMNFMIFGDFYLENKTIGKGCKRTPAWETLSTKAEVGKKIEEFWDTRIEGNPNVWKVLKSACLEQDLQVAEQIIKSSKISMLSGSLMLTFDEVGYRYDLPVYVINEGLRYGNEKVTPKLMENYKGKDLNITVRCVKCPDTQISISTANIVQDIKEKFAHVRGYNIEKIRLFFDGKELKDQLQIYHYKVTDGIVIQAHVKVEI